MKNEYFYRALFLVVVSAVVFVAFINNATPSVMKIEIDKQSGPARWQAPASADSLKNPVRGSLKAAADGKKLFEQYCVTCHGNDGSGNGITAETLNPKPANLTLKEIQKQSDGAIYWKITTGRPPMISWQYTLTDKQRWQLVDYVRQFGKDEK